MDISALSDNELEMWIATKFGWRRMLGIWHSAECRTGCSGWGSHPEPPKYCSDPAAILMLYLQLFDEVSTPELRDIKGEDQWITHQRNIYSKMRRRLDFDQSLQHIFGRVNAEIFALSRGWTAKGWEVKHV